MISKNTIIIILLIILGVTFEVAIREKLKFNILLNVIDEEKEHLNVLNETIYYLKEDNKCYKSILKSRKFYEDAIIKESKINNTTNLKKLPDDVFFTMVGQSMKWDIPLDIYFRLIDKESGFKFIDNKKTNAHGYMQVMPNTFNYLKPHIKTCNDDKINNILAGSFYLRNLYDNFKEKGYNDNKSWRFALSSYNAGKSKLKEFDEEGVFIGWSEPEYTKDYVDYITKYYN